VSGLPDPIPNHSEIMARFAHEILRIVRLVTTDLGPILGPGTSTIQMRVGVSSVDNLILDARYVFLSNHPLNRSL
jgi:hypothetical protein